MYSLSRGLLCTFTAIAGFIFVCTFGTVAAQNLVPNPNFEIYAQCPNSFSDLPLATPWDTPSFGTPDYFNACNGVQYNGDFSVPTNILGNQPARSGEGYAEAIMFCIGGLGREYIQAPLTSRLIAGETYRVSFYVSLAEKSQYAVGNIGAHLKSAPASLGGIGNLPFVPQVSNPINEIILDETGWTLIEGTFTAAGDEDYIIIGNFSDDFGTVWTEALPGSEPHAHYYIDDVSVTCLTSWIDLDSGVGGPVMALTSHSGTLCAGGAFVSAGGSPANFIAEWNGTAWAPLGSGINGFAYALASYAGNLYAGGEFTSAGVTAVNNIAKWNGFTWSPVGTPIEGTNGPVNAMLVVHETSGAVLYVGGEFTSAGGTAVNNIAKWNGVTWSSPGSGVTGGGSPHVNALGVYDDGNGPLVIAGGAFTTAGGSAANNIAAWDPATSSWSALGAGLANAPLAIHQYPREGGGMDLWVGGWEMNDPGYNALQIWNGSTWVGSPPNVNNTVSALEIHSEGDETALVAGGSFDFIEGIGVDRVASWNGTVWSAFEIGLDDYGVLALHSFSYTLYAGGAFIYLGGNPLHYIAEWDGCGGGKGIGLSIPTLTGWGVLVLLMLLVVTSIAIVRRKNRVNPNL